MTGKPEVIRFEMGAGFISTENGCRNQDVSTQIPTGFDPLHIEPFVWNRKMSDGDLSTSQFREVVKPGTGQLWSDLRYPTSRMRIRCEQ